MFSPRLLFRKTILVFIVLSLFVGVLIITARNMRQLCEDGTYCDRPELNTKSPSPNDKDADTTSATPNVTFGYPNLAPAHKEVALHACEGFPDTSNILTVMKTGASESYAKLPTQLMTTLKCPSDFLFFSDMKENIAGYTIHDSLETVLDEVKKTNPDFELYHRQNNCPVEVGECNKHFDTSKQGWTLDKYKNIHMAERTFKMRPNYDWYFFVDADTYVSYASLTEWLKHLDPNKEHYLGSVAYLGDLPFGHGGSGYLVSKALMHHMFDGKENVANKFDADIIHYCCGDAMWAKALKDEVGVGIVNAWPLINGEKPNTLPYDGNEWCQPIATLHHIGPQEISDVYELERQRNFTKPLRIKELYERFMGPHLTESRTDWDNLSDDVFLLNEQMAKYEEWEIKRAKKDGLTEQEAEAYKSFDHCKTACLSTDNCFQFLFRNHVCALSRKFRHGRPTNREEDESRRYMSWWNVEAIKKWVAEQSDCHDTFKWPIADSWF